MTPTDPFREAQARADATAQTFGQRAPAPLTGESLADYRVRLLAPYQAHSSNWKTSNLRVVARDAHALAAVEAAIHQDARQAATRNGPDIPLHAVTTTEPSGHRVTSWYGDAAEAWRPFMGAGVRYLIGINKNAGRE